MPAPPQGFGDLGYRIDAGRFGFESFANLAYVDLSTTASRRWAARRL
ncbi:MULTISPECIES: hypothetical protein [unclassified Beijerinckia]|nr:MULTISPECIES: hypothetical protein [unclassified Beijerinckia]